jgi:hypothetical protein
VAVVDVNTMLQINDYDKIEIGKVYWMTRGKTVYDVLVRVEGLTTFSFLVEPGFEVALYATTHTGWDHNKFILSEAVLHRSECDIFEISKNEFPLFVGWPVVTSFFQEAVQLI